MSLSKQERATLRMERAFAGLVAKMRHEVVRELRRAAIPAGGLVAAGPDPKAVVPGVQGLFDDLAWEADVYDDIGPIVEELIASAGAKAVAGYAFDVTNPAAAATVRAHVAAIAGWGEGISETVASTVERGVAAGWSIDELVNGLMDSGVFSDAVARNIARTEAVSATNAGEVAAWRDSGLVATKTWMATDDDRTREDHSEADGQEVPIDGYFDVGGEEADYPGDPSLSAEQRCNCRCTSYATAVDDTGNETQTALEGDDAEFGTGPGPSLPWMATRTDDEWQGTGRWVAYPSRLPEATVALTATEPEGNTVTATVTDLADAAAPPAAPPAAPAADPNTPDDGAGGHPDFSKSGMIALTPADPTALVVEGGDPPEELHVTLAFLGDDVTTLEQGALDAVNMALADVAAAFTGPIDVFVSGAGVLGPNGAVVLFLEGEELGTAYEAAWAELYDYGAESFPERHESFIPHLTLGWNIDLAAGVAFVGQTITLDRATLVMADVTTDTVLGTPDPDAATDPDPEVPPNTDAVPPPAATVQSLIAKLATRVPRPDGVADPKTIDRSRRMASTDLAPLGPDAVEVVPDEATIPMTWTGRLLVEGIETGDWRFIQEGAITWRDLPLTLMAMFANPDGGQGHAAAKIVGRIDAIWRNEENPAEVWGSGVFDESDDGRLAARLAFEKTMKGVSVDMDRMIAAIAPIPGDDGTTMTPWGEGVRLEVTAARLMGATLCPFPAFAEAWIEPADPEAALIASGPETVWRVWTPFDTPVVTLVASGGAGNGPRYPEFPPAEWFTRIAEPERTPVRVTSEGRISGYVGSWDDLHISFPYSRVNPPRSRCNYAKFRLGETECADGTVVATGPLVCDTVHPDLRLAASDAQAFYAHTGCAFADIVAWDDSYGIYIAGAIRPTATNAQVRALRGGDVSPDWRPMSGHHEAVAFVAVNNSGFKVPLALAASGGVSPLDGPRVQFDADGQALGMVAGGGMRARMGARDDIAALRAELDELAGHVMNYRRERAARIAANLTA